jgi:ribonuclease T1
MARRAAVRFALSGFLLAAALASPVTAPARTASNPDTAWSPQTVHLAQLPGAGKETFELIRRGGPFPYEKDGTVFRNRERLLPGSPRGYYREYTVQTPGVRHRGARRIVCGGPATQPDACYYSADHYASFRKIVE